MFASQLLGRETEIDVLHDLLARVEDHGAALAVRGEVGIGKSALLEEARREAEARGFAVLSAAGVQAETNFPYAALHRLLRPLLSQLGELPPPQRAAIAAAFGIQQAAAPPFLVGLGALSLLSERSISAPVLLVIDDTNWLDPLSAQVLGFLVRRIDADPIAMLLACRKGGNELGDVDLPILRLPPLDEQSSQALLDAEAPELSSEVRERVLSEAAGNPLALVELPIAWHSEPKVPILSIAPLPLTARLEEAFSARFRDLPEEAQTLLLTATLDEECSLIEISAASSR